MAIIPFDATTGFAGWISWLAVSTDGAFFVIGFAVLFLIAFIPSLIKWGVDWAFFGTTFGVMMISIPLYFLGGISETAMFIFILLFVLSVLKIAIFKE